MKRYQSVLTLLIALLLPTTLAACSEDATDTAADVDSSTTAADAGEVGDDVATNSDSGSGDLAYAIVDTDQTWCFSGDGVVVCGEDYVGQDAEYEGLQPSYQDNGDGTVTDLNTGLMWIQDAGDKTYYTDAMEELETYTFAGYDDWRLPTIKELYSLALFSGVDASVTDTSDVDGLWPLIDEDYFVFLYGDETGGNRVIDSQWLTSSIYSSEVNGNQACFFGFNFSDGRIKCYGLDETPAGGYFAQYVRGDTEYGVNDFVDNGDGTISDGATGLTWLQADNGETYDWDGALDYCESLTLGGSSDWRLPNIKELHSIVDYDRSPDATDSPAIDPIFTLSPITNEAGEPDYGFYWSSTTLISYPSNVGWATYISFGRALGYMGDPGSWIDVHGAGAQRSDPKATSEDDADRFEFGNGPQGDAVRGDNYALCVTGGDADPVDGDDPSTLGLSDADMGAPADGEVPTVSDDDGSDAGGAQGGDVPDLAAAAEVLGITEQELMDALGDPPPDLEAAAAILGITAEELEAALGLAASTG
ncbi:MAG: DUF1566 domain-containing protein [Acidimicrobiia bacterium]|nr:DUF1566 domain-containing protein [Acidimicrobiia bacterium]